MVECEWLEGLMRCVGTYVIDAGYWEMQKLGTVFSNRKVRWKEVVGRRWEVGLEDESWRWEVEGRRQ